MFVPKQPRLGLLRYLNTGKRWEQITKGVLLLVVCIVAFSIYIAVTAVTGRAAHDHEIDDPQSPSGLPLSPQWPTDFPDLFPPMGAEQAMGFESQTISSTEDPTSKSLLPSLNVKHFVEKMQRLNSEAFSRALRGCKYILLLGIESHENKGDPLIHAAEMLLLKKLGKRILYYCLARACHEKGYEQAMKIAQEHKRDEVCILFGGGGNFLSYPYADDTRIEGMTYFEGFRFIIGPQSVWPRYNEEGLPIMVGAYQSFINMTIMIREDKSLKYALKYFPSSTVIQAPDTAFQYGSVSRSMPPLYDIIWLKRSDNESTGYDIPPIPANITLLADDWRNFTSPPANTAVQQLFLRSVTGFLFLQQGRVVITDRLHGHIMAVLLGIPHVILDNRDHKIRSYYEAWSRQLDIIQLATGPDDAIDKAIGLLRKYDQQLPAVIKDESIANDSIYDSVTSADDDDNGG